MMALLTFIGFSCYHFGEQHFCHVLDQNNGASRLFYFGYGSLILGMLFRLNIEATQNIIIELTKIKLEVSFFDIFLLLGIAISFFVGFIIRNTFSKDMDFFKEFFLIALFVLIFELASLLWAFAIYFIVWHSLPSLSDQIKSLYGQRTTASFISYMKSSFVYWVICMIGLGIVYIVSIKLRINFITLFFAFLAAITIPHVLVMYHLNKK